MLTMMSAEWGLKILGTPKEKAGYLSKFWWTNMIKVIKYLYHVRVQSGQVHKPWKCSALYWGDHIFAQVPVRHAFKHRLLPNQCCGRHVQVIQIAKSSERSTRDCLYLSIVNRPVISTIAISTIFASERQSAYSWFKLTRGANAALLIVVRLVLIILLYIVCRLI